MSLLFTSRCPTKMTHFTLAFMSTYFVLLTKEITVPKILSGDQNDNSSKAYMTEKIGEPRNDSCKFYPIYEI